MPESVDETVEFSLDQHFANQFFVRDLKALKAEIGAATHVGLVRQRNEDHFAVARRVRTSELLLSNLPSADSHHTRDETYALIVADGVGGGASGDRASRLALETVFELASQASHWVMKVDTVDVADMRRRISAYVDKIQAAFRKSAAADRRLEGMGTTWTSAYVVGSYAFLAHIGDSRGYLFRNQRLQQITRDQTLAQDLVDTGVPEQAVTKFTNLLTNSLGGSQTSVVAEVYPVAIQPGDRLMLCTDGLTDMVSADRIAELLAPLSDQPQACCDALVAEALRAGGRDNVTVILCDVH